ncbi:S27A3 protein, partial [Anseranas semipalmata]|nr:S27A3 protein [Anseranas semipalmata]
MAALVLRPGCRLDGPGLYRHMEELLPPYARPRFLRLQVTGYRGGGRGAHGDGGGPSTSLSPRQERLEVTETFKQRKVRLAQEGFDPARVPDPLFLLDEATKAYVPLGPALWEDVIAGRVRI